MDTVIGFISSAGGLVVLGLVAVTVVRYIRLSRSAKKLKETT